MHLHTITIILKKSKLLVYRVVHTGGYMLLTLLIVTSLAIQLLRFWVVYYQFLLSRAALRRFHFLVEFTGRLHSDLVASARVFPCIMDLLVVLREVIRPQDWPLQELLHILGRVRIVIVLETLGQRMRLNLFIHID